MATTMKTADTRDKETAQRLCGNAQSPRPRASPHSLPAAKAVMDETTGPRPGADSEGMQDRTRRPTDPRPHRAARMLKVCVTWMQSAQRGDL